MSAGTKSAVAFCQSHYLTTLHFQDQVKQTQYLFCNIGLRLIPPPLQVALHKFPIAAGTICATLFCHGRYLTTLLSCPQVKQTKKSLFSIFRPTTKLHLQPTKRHKKEKTVYNNPKQD
jgi:hypothetical protein